MAGMLSVAGFLASDAGKKALAESIKPVKKILPERPSYSCERCGEEDCSPNTEAFELSGEFCCDECAEEIFEENSQFGMGA